MAIYLICATIRCCMPVNKTSCDVGKTNHMSRSVCLQRSVLLRMRLSHFNQRQLFMHGCGSCMGVALAWVWLLHGCGSCMGVALAWVWLLHGCGSCMGVALYQHCFGLKLVATLAAATPIKKAADFIGVTRDHDWIPLWP